MKIKMTKILVLPLILCLMLSSCDWNKDKPTVPKESWSTSLFKRLRNVIFLSGIDFDTGKPIVINPSSKMELKPCNSVDYPTRQIKEECNVEIVDDNNSASILEAIAKSRQVITGKIKIDGEEREARFFVSVTALYKGSKCGYKWMAGRLYWVCEE